MGNATSNKFNDSPAHENSEQQKDDKKSPAKKSEADKAKKSVGQEQTQSSGWFGGLFKGFGKPKNQMILPDDKNPTVSC
jgi:hypothetical protein